MGKKLNNLSVLFMFFFCFSIAYGQDDATAASLYNQGLEKLKAKEYNEALTLLEQSMEKADPEADKKVVDLAKKNAAFACYYIGNDLRKADKFEDALNIYSKGIDYNKGVYSNFIGRAQALEDKGEKAASVKAYLTAAEMTKKAGKADRAEQLVSKAANFAAVAFGKKEYAEAIETAETYLAIDSTSSETHYYLSQSLLAKGQKEKALDHAVKSIELAGEASDKNKLYFGKAEAHEALGQKEKALEAYKMVSGDTYAERAKFKVDQLSGGN